MRVVVTGASGNVGTSVLEALGREPEVKEIVGIARRVPEVSYPKVEWAGADVDHRRSGAALLRRRRGRPPRLGDPAEPRRVRHRADQRRGVAPRLRRRRPGRRRRPRPRLLGRRLQPRPEGTPGRRVLAGRRHPDLLLLAPQGGGGNDARRLRTARAGGPRRPPPPRADLQGRGRQRDPPPLRRPLPARLPGPQAAGAARPAGAAAALPGGPLARRRRGLPAGGGPRRPRRLQHRRRAGDRGRGAARVLRRPQLPAAGPRPARRRRS